MSTSTSRLGRGAGAATDAPENNAAEYDGDGEEEDISYTAYTPTKFKGGKPHPDPVVENSTLAAVAPPNITHELTMSNVIIDDGRLSSLQLEAITYGCQRHEIDLPKNGSNGITYRAGFLLGDGAGMGKGRTLAGFVAEHPGRRHIWISSSSNLYEDAVRDLDDLGLEDMCQELKSFSIDRVPNGKDGVMFLSYHLLIQTARGRAGCNRFDQLVQWCCGDSNAEDFDGLLMLDECHKAKTINLDDNGNTTSGTTLIASMVVKLQDKLPRARVVYCSATAVSQPRNLGFMSRLGLWGPGTEYPRGFNQFLDRIEEVGTGAMELHAMHLKSIGAIVTRTLSFAVCSFETVEVNVDSNFQKLYNRCTDFWMHMMDRCKRDKDSQRSFWAAHQQFFRLLCVASKVDKAIEIAKNAVSAGDCCVIGLQSTGEKIEDTSDSFGSALSRVLKQTIINIYLPPKPEFVMEPDFDMSDNNDTGDVSMPSEGTPSTAGPTERSNQCSFFAQAAKYNVGGGLPRIDHLGIDETRTSKKRNCDILCSDGCGVEVSCGKQVKPSIIHWEEITSYHGEEMVKYQNAVKEVMIMIQRAKRLRLPMNPLDRIIDELGGPCKVAELTGRTERPVKRGHQIIREKRGESNIDEKNHFQKGTKLIAVISDAGSTGVSLQADKRVANKKRRFHVTLELPWSADKAIQQLGRTHRSNQLSGPAYKMLLTDLPGDKRFGSALTKNLISLGALTQGDRRATGSANSLGLANFDVDNKIGNRAVKHMFEVTWSNSPVELDGNDNRATVAFTVFIMMIEDILSRAIDDTGSWKNNLVLQHDSESSFIHDLLTGRCEALAQNRVDAIKRGRSINGLNLQRKNGESKEAIAGRIRAEVKAAKDSGLSFNILCQHWLYDVGLTYQCETAPRVSTFLNRLLGMCLLRQRLMFDYFMYFVNKEVSQAKQAGKFDGGIKTLKDVIEIVWLKRLRFSNAIDDHVNIYKLTQDQGFSQEDVMRLFNEAKENNNDADFYVDKRIKFTKVFLIIKQGHSGSCLVVRPNIGRRTESECSIQKKINDGKLVKVNSCDAKTIWMKEFECANILATQVYQPTCPGRVKVNHLISGAIIPNLVKVLQAVNGESTKSSLQGVRVKTRTEEHAGLLLKNEAALQRLEIFFEKKFPEQTNASKKSAARLDKPRRRPDFTSSQEDIICSALKDGCKSEILARHGANSVQRGSLQTLNPGVWLNDEILNFFIQQCLAKRDEKLCANEPGRKRSHFFSSFFIQKMFDEKNNNKKLNGQYNYNNVKAWSTKVPGEDIFNLKYLVCPINRDNQHWTSAVIFMEEKRIQYYDSLGCTDWTKLNGLLQYLKDEHRVKNGGELDVKEWKLVACTSDTPRQRGGIDCGVFTCMFCYYILKDTPLPKRFSDRFISKCRKFIALDIMSSFAVKKL